MALKYTGSSDVFIFGGRRYAKPELYKKNPSMYDASYDSPIRGLTVEKAQTYIESSSLHSFEEGGEDLEEKLTAPPVIGVDTALVDPPVAPNKK
jgi:hypothetical protein